LNFPDLLDWSNRAQLLVINVARANTHYELATSVRR